MNAIVSRLIRSVRCTAACVLVVAACTRTTADPAQVLFVRVGGSSSMAPTMAALADAFEAQHSNIAVEVQPTDSLAGLEELLSGRIDVAAVSWKPAGEHTRAGVRDVPLGRDALAVVVHPDNTVPGLTLLQLRALFRGEVLEWSALGGPSAEPILISREEGSGTRAAFEELVMGGDRVTLNALIMPHSSAVVEYVSSHPAAVGYVSASALSGSVRALPIEEVMPAAETTRTGAYHLTVLLHLYYSDPAPSHVQAFVDFALSPAGQATVARYHVPLR